MNKTLATIWAGTALLGGGVAVTDAKINPYTDQIDRVEIVTVADVSDAGEQKVELKKDKPEVRFKKWNGEVDLGLTYDTVKANGNRPLLSNKMEYKDSKQEVHAYPLTEGFEIEVILNEKPDTNVVTFTLDNWEDLDFFYQPELTQEEIDGGSVRPENVVGSYAVYHKEKKNHIEGNTNYATGKIGHIYRPKIIDSAGTEVWGDLHIENGILSVTIPQEFLDKAVYPVRHAAGLTFGYTGTGGTAYQLYYNASYGDEAQIQAGDFTLSENGSISKLSVLVNALPVTYTECKLFSGIYDAGQGTLQSRNGEGLSLVVSSTGWKDLSYSSQPALSANNYKLAMFADCDGAGNYQSLTTLGDTSGGTNSLSFSGSQGEYDLASTPDVLSEDGSGSGVVYYIGTTYGSIKHSIYATYTADAPVSGGGGNIIIFE